MYNLNLLRQTPSVHGEIQQVIARLGVLNVFSAMQEICHKRSQPEPSATNLIEHAALRAAWKDGYIEAIDDLTNFFKYIDMPKDAEIKRPLADFNAARVLLDRGEIDKEEYERLTNG